MTNVFGKKKISKEDAYAAMFAFIKIHETRFDSEELKIVLSEMSLSADGLPMDPGIVGDWKKCIELAQAGKVNIKAVFIKPTDS